LIRIFQLFLRALNTNRSCELRHGVVLCGQLSLNFTHLTPLDFTIMKRTIPPGNQIVATSSWTDDTLWKFGVCYESSDDYTKMFTEEERNEPPSVDIQVIQEHYDSIVAPFPGFQKKDILACDGRFSRFWYCLQTVTLHLNLKNSLNDFITELLRLAVEEPHATALAHRDATSLKMKGETEEKRFFVGVKDDYNTYAIVYNNSYENGAAEAVATAVSVFQDEQNVRRRNKLPILTNHPFLIAVCRATEIFFLRVNLPQKFAEAVQKENVDDKKHNYDDITLQRFPETGALNFFVKAQFDLIVKCLSCWRYAVRHANAKLAKYEKEENDDDNSKDEDDDSDEDKNNGVSLLRSIHKIDEFLKKINEPGARKYI